MLDKDDWNVIELGDFRGGQLDDVPECVKIALHNAYELILWYDSDSRQPGSGAFHDSHQKTLGAAKHVNR